MESPKQIYAERLLGMAVGMFLVVSIVNATGNAESVRVALYLVMAAALVGSLVLSLLYRFRDKPRQQKEDA